MREMGNREEFPFSPPFFSSDFFPRGKNKMHPIFVSEKPPLGGLPKTGTGEKCRSTKIVKESGHFQCSNG